MFALEYEMSVQLSLVWVCCGNMAPKRSARGTTKDAEAAGSDADVEDDDVESSGSEDDDREFFINDGSVDDDSDGICEDSDGGDDAESSGDERTGHAGNGSVQWLNFACAWGAARTQQLVLQGAFRHSRSRRPQCASRRLSAVHTVPVLF